MYNLAKEIESVARKSDTQFFYKSKVKKILVKNNKITGIELNDSRVIHSNTVIFNGFEVHLDFGGDLLIEGFYPVALSYDFLEVALKVMTGVDVPHLSDYVKPTAILFNEGNSINR